MPMIITKHIMVLPSEIAVIKMFFDGVINNCIFHLKFKVDFVSFENKILFSKNFSNTEMEDGVDMD